MSPVADSGCVEIPERETVKDRGYQVQKSSPRPRPSCKTPQVSLKALPALYATLNCYAVLTVFELNINRHTV